MSKNIFKSIGALFVGFIVSALLSTITDLALETTGVITGPDEGLFIPWMIILVIIYRCVYIAFGGYLLARLAPSKPMVHAIILGGITIILTMVGTYTVGFGKAPLWFGYTLAILTLPSLWLGIKIEESFRRSK